MFVIKLHTFKVFSFAWFNYAYHRKRFIYDIREKVIIYLILNMSFVMDSLMCVCRGGCSFIDQHPNM